MNTPRITFPTRSLLNGMPYINAVSTDIRTRFAKISEQQQKKRKHDSTPKVKA